MLCRHPFPTRHISSWSQRSPFTLQSLCQVFRHRCEERDQYTAFKSVGKLLPHSVILKKLVRHGYPEWGGWEYLEYLVGNMKWFSFQPSVGRLYKLFCLSVLACISGWLGGCYVDQASLEVTQICLSPLPELLRLKMCTPTSSLML